MMNQVRMISAIRSAFELKSIFSVRKVKSPKSVHFKTDDSLTPCNDNPLENSHEVLEGIF